MHTDRYNHIITNTHRTTHTSTCTHIHHGYANKKKHTEIHIQNLTHAQRNSDTQIHTHTKKDTQKHIQQHTHIHKYTQTNTDT